MNKDFLRMAFKPLTLINKIKKKEDIIFFYSNLGFRDNVKAFYDYLIEEGYNKKYPIVVSINDWEDYQKNIPENVTFVDNKQGIKYFMKSKYAFYCFGKYPIKPSRKQMVVNLWHGMPLKRVGNMEMGLEDIDYNFFTKIISTSELFNPILEKSFSCKDSQIEILGQPRNDELFKANPIMDGAMKRGSDKVILWLPTYRNEAQEFPVPCITKEQADVLNRYLKEQNCRMIIKIHPLQQHSEKLTKFSHIEFVTQEMLQKGKMTVYSLLRGADALITDYSSVYFDYLLLDRPIAFTVNDIKQYQEERGFVFDNPFDYMPGMHIENIDEIKQFILNVKNEIDEDKEFRAKINEEVNFYKDGDSCKRIAEKYLPEA